MIATDVLEAAKRPAFWPKRPEASRTLISQLRSCRTCSSVPCGNKDSPDWSR